MRELFNPDSKFMRAMSRIGDLLLLNFFFLITSLPIITLGASVTSMYAVCFRFGTDRETGTIKGYFTAFKDNFKQATLMWLGLLFLLAATGATVVLFLLMPGWMHYLWIPFAIAFILALFITLFAFPLLSQFDNRNSVTFKNALILSIAYLPRVVLMAVMVLFPIWLLFKDLYIFLHCGFLFMTLYFSTITYLSSLLLKKVFKPFMGDQEETIEENQEETL